MLSTNRKLCAQYKTHPFTIHLTPQHTARAPCTYVHGAPSSMYSVQLNQLATHSRHLAQWLVFGPWLSTPPPAAGRLQHPSGVRSSAHLAAPCVVMAAVPSGSMHVGPIVVSATPLAGAIYAGSVAKVALFLRCQPSSDGACFLCFFAGVHTCTLMDSCSLHRCCQSEYYIRCFRNMCRLGDCAAARSCRRLCPTQPALPCCEHGRPQVFPFREVGDRYSPS